jgi:5-methylcytosine-specific restriction endonuclease McrA
VLFSMLVMQTLRVVFRFASVTALPRRARPCIVLASVRRSQRRACRAEKSGTRRRICARLLSSAPRRRGLLNAPVLVLNQNYEPLNVCDIRRAFNLLGAEKAELLERNHQVIHTPTLAIAAPSVIRLVYLVRRPRPRVKLSRREVFARDAHSCQYCGTGSRDLTIDHVMPKHRGGRHEWENLVTACRACNHRKGSKTLIEARMTLRREPRAPRADVRYLYGTYLADEQNDAWRSYLFLSDSPGQRA